VPADAPRYEGGGGMVLGEVGDADGGRWSFTGAIFLVLLHHKCLSPTAIQEMSAVLTADAEGFGAPRPGDGSVDGASMEHETQAMVLHDAVLLLDSRDVTHATMQERFCSHLPYSHLPYSHLR